MPKELVEDVAKTVPIKDYKWEEKGKEWKRRVFPFGILVIVGMIFLLLPYDALHYIAFFFIPAAFIALGKATRRLGVFYRGSLSARRLETDPKEVRWWASAFLVIGLVLLFIAISATLFRLLIFIF